MATVVRYLLGANTPQGFVSRFDQLGDKQKGWRTTVIKGGPGTGKSTMMRKLSGAMEDRCLYIEHIHCSSDVDSLDGVVFPDYKLSIADGTLPHPLEIKYPGAYENLVSLCGCWDKDRLFAQREELIGLADKISGCHRQAVSYLGGADALLGEIRTIAAAATSKEKIRRLAARIAKNEFPKVPGPGEEWVRLISAVTNKGPVLFEDTIEALAPKLYVIDDPWGAAAPELLAALRGLALEAGHDVITCACPMAPFTRIDHLLLPGLGVGFATRNRFHPVELTPYRVIHARRFTDVDQVGGRKLRIKFLTRAADAMLEQAAQRIGEAKALHDQLEAHYQAAMDFGQVEALTQQVVAQFLKDSDY